MLAIISSSAPEELPLALASRGFQILRLPPHPALPSSLSSHPDLLLFFAKDAIITPKSYQKIAEKELATVSKLAQKPILFLDTELGASYPEDVPLNALFMDQILFANPKTVANEILSCTDKLCRVRQGYTKCAVLPVGKKALITADQGIASASRSAGFDVLQITPGNIILPGYDTGFIGGASSHSPYEDCENIFFCGSLDRHPQGHEIADFCLRHKKTPISLTSDVLYDVGTLFLI